jgi:hypothetical protein
MTLFESLGYRTYESRRLRRFRSATWRGDADLVAFGPTYPHAEQDLKTLKELDY